LGCGMERQGRGVRVLLAFDSFKDTLAAEEVAALVEEALRVHVPEDRLEVRVRHLSDGGEGFLQVFAQSRRELELRSVRVTGPLCRVGADGRTEAAQEVEAQYGIFLASQTDASGAERKVRVGVAEMAQAAGLEQVPRRSRDPLLTTSRGVGELLAHLAGAEGCGRVILGVGGSATSDGGLGMLPPLGVAVAVRGGVAGPAATLAGRDLCSLEGLPGPLGNALAGVELQVACDVQNPFTGPAGAVHVFAAQKGADAAARARLEEAMLRLEDCFASRGRMGPAFRGMPGCGAAGGVAGCLLSVAENASLQRGILVIDEALQLSEAVEWADVVFTGEGSYDAQTESGKVVSHVEQLCLNGGKRLVVLCGRTDRQLQAGGMHLCHDLASRFGAERSMAEAGACLREILPEVCAAVPEFVAAAATE